ncbi:hypothetical protein [Streptomyces indicus]|uniref:Uncharacterized protein n=1 Tax=Streptomyces indicus TaxID=417292 RepID=A0A1G9GD44_9ACTN|nr:hypothetical protein [Streptomyces indicus]SDK98203.1 hypothetical protein SAMN05421806_115120 [Streptomyces indicus]
MCATCNDLVRTASMIAVLDDYANEPDADEEFIDVLAFGLNASLFLVYDPSVYPPTGHTYPATG